MKTVLLVGIIMFYSICVGITSEFTGLMPWDRQTITVDSAEKNPFESSVKLALKQTAINKITELNQKLKWATTNEQQGEIIVLMYFWYGYLTAINENIK